MRILIFGITLFGINSVIAQTSVYDCQSNSAVTPAIINAAGSVFQQQCVEFPDNQTFMFNNTFNKEVQANTEIRIEPGFTAGAFAGSGGMKLSVTAKSDFDVAVMNYPDLMNVLKLEKLELGVKLPTELQTKVNNFVQKVPNSTQVNPFLEWQLRVVAEFKQEDFSFIHSVDGFYFRNFVRNDATDYWDDLGTQHPFRIRFAPQRLGKWTCTIKIFVNNVQSYTSIPFTFNVINSGNPGFVKKHSNGKNLVRGNDSYFIYPVGTNLAFPGGGESGLIDYDGGPNYIPNFKMHYLKDYLNNVSAYADAGGKYLRYIVSQPSSEIEFEKLGDYYNRLMFATEIDNLLDLAHNRDILIHFNLMLHTSIMKSGDYSHFNWDFGTNDGIFTQNPYCYSTAFNTETPSDMILNTSNLIDGHAALDYLKQRYRYYIARYGYSTNIQFFELLSEPWHINEVITDTIGTRYQPAVTGHNSEGDIARQAIRQFHGQMADYIKNHLHHDNHLLATVGRLPVATTYGIEDFDANGNYIPLNHPNVIQEDSWSNPNIDLATISLYSAHPIIMINTKENPDLGNDNIGFNQGEKSIAFSAHQIYEAYGKPTIFAECGIGDNAQDCSQNKMHEFYARRFGFSGIAGFNMWEGWNYGDPNTPYVNNHTVYWPSVIHVQNHMNGYDARSVIGTNWVQGREVQKGNEEDATREQQYYISSDKERCVGYIANRTYNPYTLNVIPNSKCSELNVGANNDVFLSLQSCYGPVLTCPKLEIQGLKPNTDYNIDWYHYGNGAYFYSDCFNTTGNGVWRMDHPVLDMQSPLLYYVIKQQNCTSRMTVNQPTSEEESGTALRNSTIPDESRWKIYPNPTENLLIISGTDSLNNLRLYDNKGKLILERTLPGLEEFELPVQYLNQGVYFIELNNAGKQLRFVKL